MVTRWIPLRVDVSHSGDKAPQQVRQHLGSLCGSLALWLRLSAQGRRLRPRNSQREEDRLREGGKKVVITNNKVASLFLAMWVMEHLIIESILKKSRFDLFPAIKFQWRLLNIFREYHISFIVIKNCSKNHHWWQLLWESALKVQSSGFLFLGPWAYLSCSHTQDHDTYH